MSRDDTLRAVHAAFSDWTRPSRVTDDVPGDPERQMIEADFGRKSPDALTYDECSMLLVDGGLVTRDAFFYFLPRLAKAVLWEGGDWTLLWLRLDVLGAEGLTSQQTEAVSRLQAELEVIEAEMDE